MKSLRELFRIGKGPSSSHTMGPQRAARIFADRNQGARSFTVTLYGSLAATGRGHMTDVAVMGELEPVAPVSIVWQPAVFLPYHPNAMKLQAHDAEGNTTDEWTVYSVGGGALSEGETDTGLLDTPDVYDMNTMTAIMDWCNNTGRSYWEYVGMCEDSGILAFFLLQLIQGKLDAGGGIRVIVGSVAAMPMAYSASGNLWLVLLVTILIGAVYFVLTSWLMKNKLDLE